MKIVNNKYLKLSLYLSLFCITGTKLALADTPEYTEHYKVYNRSSYPITNLAISDFAIYDYGVYHDPIISDDLETQQGIFPASGLGGLVSYFTGSNTNAWDISYCSSSKCYKSDISVDTCTLDGNDIFSGSTAAIAIYDDGKINIQMADNRTCTLQLDKPAQNPVSPQYTEHYKVTNNSLETITSLSISDFVEVYNGQYSLYHDPVLYVDTLSPAERAPSSGLGGLVSYYNLGTNLPHGGYALNGWDISYCSSSTCYKSDISVDTCSLKSDDIFDDSTVNISLLDDGNVAVFMPSGANCVFKLNTYSPGL